MDLEQDSADLVPELAEFDRRLQPVPREGSPERPTRWRSTRDTLVDRSGAQLGFGESSCEWDDADL